MIGGTVMAIVALLFGLLFLGLALGMVIVARNAETPEYRRSRRTIDALIMAVIGVVWLAGSFLIAAMSWSTPDAMMMGGG